VSAVRLAVATSRPQRAPSIELPGLYRASVAALRCGIALSSIIDTAWLMSQR
jgi:hypothetical protein